MFRKLLLTLSLVAMVGLITAQSLQFEHEGAICEDGQTIVTPYDEVFGEYVLHLQLRNLTDNEMNVIIEQEIVHAVPDALAYFCWGMCYEAGVTVSRPVAIPAQTLSDQDLSFHVMLDPLSEEIEEVIYYAYDANDAGKRISLRVLAGEGANVTENTLSMGHVYPNPATNQIHVNFKCEHNTGATVVVYNLLGQEVKSQKVSGIQGKVDINVEDLQPGIYFCSLRADNCVAQTEKFIVKR